MDTKQQGIQLGATFGSGRIFQQTSFFACRFIWNASEQTFLSQGKQLRRRQSI
jgi:hypothetical protein